MIELERSIVDDFHHYSVLRDGATIATAKWNKVGSSAVLHNEVFKFSKSNLLSFLSLFEEVQDDMRDAGCITAVVIDKIESVNELRKKYWKIMGFSISGTAEGLFFMIRGL